MSQAHDDPKSALAAEFLPFDPSFLRDPYPFYARARREAPVFWSPVMNAWVVSRYDDVVAILTDHERFSSTETLQFGFGDLAPEALEVLSTGGYPFTAMAINSDPPLH